MERRLVQRSLADYAFRRRLLEDPRAAVEEELATRLPEEVQVRTVEDTPDTIYLVLPMASPISEGGKLSERELEVVAGGGDDIGNTWGSINPARLAILVSSAASKALSE